MYEGFVLESVWESVNLFFVLAFPMLVVVAAAGILVSLLQAVTTVREGASLYAAKFLSLIALCYFLLPSFVDSFLELTRRLWGQG